MEILVSTILQQQQFTNVRTNVVGAGGNEVDVTANRQIQVVNGVQTTPIVCEAKAYADAVNMPTWQRFLGKLFIERAGNPATIGILVALGGINGNVAGSFSSLKERDAGLLVFEGSDLVLMARKAGQIAEDVDVGPVVFNEWRLRPAGVEVAYYQGAYYYLVWWDGDRYSVVDSRGNNLAEAEVETLRGALEASLPGSLIATAEARAEAERRHDARLTVLNRLMRREPVSLDQISESDDLRGFEDELFCKVGDGVVSLAPAASLDATGVTRLFAFLVEQSFKPAQLSYMLEHDFQAYVLRLVDLLPEVQAGFQVQGVEYQTLREIAPLFPSIWSRLAQPNPMITTHRADGEPVVDEAVLEADRTSFWQAIADAVRADYAHPSLRGFLYDYMDVAELEERNFLQVKGKKGPIGHSVETVSRRAVRQFVKDGGTNEGPVYVLVLLLPGLGEPWEDIHPQPEFPLSTPQAR